MNQLQPLTRKDYGSFGREIDLYTNFYEVKYDAKMKIYIYEVEIDLPPQVLKKNRSMAMDVFQKMIHQYRSPYFQNACPVFDGSKLLYTNQKLPQLDKRVSGS
eukprot:sb/3478243/